MFIGLLPSGDLFDRPGECRPQGLFDHRPTGLADGHQPMDTLPISSHGPASTRPGLETGTQLVLDSSCVPVSAPHVLERTETPAGDVSGACFGVWMATLRFSAE